MAPRDFQQQLVREALLALEPAVAAATSPWRRDALFEGIGWDLAAVAGMSDADLDAWLDSVATAVQGVVAIVQQPPATLDDVAGVLGTIQAATDALRNLPPALRNVPTAVIPAGLFAEDLIAYLLVAWLRRRHPALLHVLRMLTIVRLQTESPISDPFPATGRPMRLARSRHQLRLRQVPALLRDPVGILKAEYLPGGLQTDAEAEIAATRLFGRLADLLHACNVDARNGLDAGPGPLDPASQHLARTMMTIRVPYGAGPVKGTLGATFALSSAESGDLGLVIVPRGDLAFTQPAGSWSVVVKIAAAAGGIAIGRHGLTLPAGIGGEVSASVAATKAGEDDVPAVVIGSATGTRIELGSVRFEVSGAFGGNQDDYGVLSEVSSAAVVIAAGDGDGFLKQVLPPEGVRTEFDLGLGWSQSRGLTFRGSAGLDATFPIGKDIGGVVRVEQVHLSVHPDNDGVEAIVGTTVSVQLGPIKAAVERFGLTAQLTFRETGNLGPANLALTFQPPAGAALEIDAGVVTGGGYLLFDPARAQYAGAVHLEVAKRLNITAFGLLTTRMPDGSPGFSLLVLISVKFTPGVPLGYGFTLTGIGGLLGVNRTVAVDPLRAGLRGGTIGRTLFPDDPVRNAPQIVSDLQTIFPPATGRFVFGPMVQITWGTPKPVLTLDLGLVLELPAPVRLVILGRLRVLLPDAKAPVVRLQLDSLGVIDFESGDVALDAVLYDSQISQFAVTGEMALRANFGVRPNFVLAVGGFHPRFQAPEGFPALGRVTIALAAGNNPRLRLDAYLALTTNTLQFGAHVDLYAEAAGFNIQGSLGFDTLIQFSPFGLLAEIQAAVALKRGSTSIMCVMVELTLTGPAPWRAQGRANFTVLFLSGSIRFDVQFGRAAPPEMPAPAHVTPLLLTALRDAGNWTTQLPPGEHPVAAIRDTGGAAVYVHPLADLQVRQRVVPLGREISRFGSTAVAGDRRFTVAVLAASGAVLTDEQAGVTPVDDFFAPAQFTEMTDDEKLVAPAFEPMQAGIRFGVRRYIAGAGFAEEEMSYERKAVYGPAPGTARELVRDAAIAARKVPDARGPAVPVVRAGFIERVASTGAAGRAPLDRAGASKYAAPRRAIALKPPRFVAATGRGAAAKPVELPSHGGKPGKRVSGSYAEAAEAMGTRLPRDPRQRRRVHVVPSYAEAIK